MAARKKAAGKAAESSAEAVGGLGMEMEREIAALCEACGNPAGFYTAMDRILSLKGQVDVEPVEFCIRQSDVVKRYTGETFEIVVTTGGAMYHTYGGYRVSASVRDFSLYSTLVSMCDFLNGSGTDGLTAEETEMAAGDVEAKSYVLSSLMWCFGDIDATYGIATAVVHEMAELAEKYWNEPLADEDHAANSEFEDAVMAIESVKESEREEVGRK